MSLSWQLGILAAVTFFGWLIGRVQTGRRELAVQDTQSDYFKGLAFLFENKTDEAVESFIRSLEVNPDTLETHLALGGLFRKRGETEKALMVHQNLFGRPDLPKHVTHQVQLELARDYNSSGLLGRAEALFNDLVDQSPDLRVEALSALLEIYSSEKEWQKCIQVGQKLGRKITPAQQVALSHYYCELAQSQIHQGELVKAAKNIKQAISTHKKNVRANLQLAELETQNKKYRAAIKQCRKAMEMNPGYADQVLPILASLSRLDQSEKQYRQYLAELASKHPIPTIQLAYAECLRAEDGFDFARDYLLSKVEEQPSKKGIEALLEWQSLNTHNDQDRSTQHAMHRTLVAWLGKLSSDKPAQSCSQCGFTTSAHLWQCPQCKNWETIADQEDRLALK